MYKYEVTLMVAFICLSISTVSVGSMLTDPGLCQQDNDCGWNSYCDHGQCWCKQGYQRQTDNKNCFDGSCGVEGCIQCLDKKFCKRCVSFLIAGTGQCVSKCSTEYTFLVEGDENGRVCKAESAGLSLVYVSIIIAACAAVLVIILTALTIHYKMKTNKERELRLKVLAEFVNKEKWKKVEEATQVGKSDGYKHAESRLDRLHYYHQVSLLAPHIDTFVAMLRDAKLKCHSLGLSDGRQLLYRNLVHQLCRVLTVISDRMAAMPPDGNLLLDWARQVLVDYKRYQKPTFFKQSIWAFRGAPPPTRTTPSESSMTDQFRSSGCHLEADREVAEITGIPFSSEDNEPIEV